MITSVAGLRGGGYEAAHAAAESAQFGLAGSLDREVRGEGIRVGTTCPAGARTEFAVGTGRVEADPALHDFLQTVTLHSATSLKPEDVGAAVLSVPRQPRRMRTTLWSTYSMAESS